MVTGSKGYSAAKVRKLRAARNAVTKAASLLRNRSGGNLRAPLATYGWYGRYNRRGRSELKTVDTALNQVISNTGTMFLFNGISQGTDYTNRDGRIVTMKSIYWRFSITPNINATALAAGDSVRILIVYDCQTNGTAPTPANILQVVNPHSPMNLNFRDRFKVLYDKQIGMSAAIYTTGALTTGSPTLKSFSMYKKLDMETVYQSTAGAVADISTGAVYLMLLGLADQGSQCIGYCRIRFTDK